MDVESSDEDSAGPSTSTNYRSGIPLKTSDENTQSSDPRK